jgi:hypothetical protein
MHKLYIHLSIFRYMHIRMGSGWGIIVQGSWRHKLTWSTSEPAVGDHPSKQAHSDAGEFRHTRPGIAHSPPTTNEAAGLEASGCSAIPPWRETAEATAGCSGAGARTSEAGDGAGRRRPTCRRHTLNVGRLWLYGSPKARAQINCGSSRAVGQVSFR